MLISHADVIDECIPAWLAFQMQPATANQRLSFAGKCHPRQGMALFADFEAVYGSLLLPKEIPPRLSLQTAAALRAAIAARRGKEKRKFQKRSLISA